jgi:hypothetical protein
MRPAVELSRSLTSCLPWRPIGADEPREFSGTVHLWPARSGQSTTSERGLLLKSHRPELHRAGLMSLCPSRRRRNVKAQSDNPDESCLHNLLRLYR